MGKMRYALFFFFFFKQKTAYEIRLSLVGSEMCIRDRKIPLLCQLHGVIGNPRTGTVGHNQQSRPLGVICLPAHSFLFQSRVFGLKFQVVLLKLIRVQVETLDDAFGSIRCAGSGPAGLRKIGGVYLAAKNDRLHHLSQNPALILADGVLGQMMELVVFRREVDPADLPEPSWSTTGATDRPKRIIKSLYLDPDELEQHNLKLQAKYTRLKQEAVRWKTYDAEGSRLLIVAYGTSARVAYHAMELAEERDLPVGLFRPLTVYPYPHEALRQVVEEEDIERVL